MEAYKFFVFYRWTKNTGGHQDSGYGRAAVARNSPIADMDEIESIENQLARQNNLSSVTVSNIIAFPIQ